MIYSIKENFKEISFEETDLNKPVVAIIGKDEIGRFGEKFGFPTAVVEGCLTESELFRTDVEVHHDYTFTQMKIANDGAEDDCIALLVKSNLMLVVSVCDTDNSVAAKLSAAINRLPSDRVSVVRVLCAFIESLISGGNKTIELIRNEIIQMEESVIKDEAGEEFNINLLEIKKRLLKLHNYYEQILDIAEAIEENENDIFDEEHLIYASNLTNKVTRLKENTDSLRNSSDHLQDAYSAALDMKMNHTMKIFTVITTIFFPLTIIVGWYGMNFSSMPEFTWNYGYLYVIALSVLTVAALVIIFKKKKWF